jgi:hypothetical protein
MTMFQAVKSPFEGEPRTTEGRDVQGRRAFAITARVLSPENAQIADLMAILFVPFFWFVTYQAILGQSEASHYWGYAAWAVLPLLALPLVRVMNRYLMRHEVMIEITDTTFAVSQGGDYAVFDRNLPHSFSVLPHDKAPDEQDEIDASRRSGPGKAPRRYYTRAYVVTYDYVGQRNDVVALMGQRDANALHARLVLCDKLLEAQRQRKGHAPFDAEGGWGAETGDIAEVH